MRWTYERLVEETGKVRPSAQWRWFKNAFGVDVPTDIAGTPIMTDETFAEMVKRACGIHQSKSEPQLGKKVRLRK